MAATLQVPIEIVDHGLASTIASATTFERTRIGFDTTDYDGVTAYDFEINGKNSDSTNKDVLLVDSTGATVATCTLTTAMSSTSGTRVRATFSPTSGADTYRVKTPSTTATNDVGVYEGRIIVTQVNATKTRIQIPLVQSNESSRDANTTGVADQTTSASYTQGTADLYSLWRRSDAAFATVDTGSPWTLEVVYDISSSAQTVGVALFNQTDNLQVTGGEVTHTGNTTITRDTVSFASGATNFTDAKDYELRIKASGAATGRLYRACLYVKLTPISLAEIYFRFCKYRPGVVATAATGRQRIFITASDFSNPAYNHESTGRESTLGTTVVWMQDGTTTDTGTTGSNVTGSDINFDSTTRARVRTGILTLTSGDRFISDIVWTSGVQVLTSSWLMVSINADLLMPGSCM